MPLLEIKSHLAHGSPSLPFGMFFFAVYLQLVQAPRTVSPRVAFLLAPPFFFFALVD